MVSDVGACVLEQADELERGRLARVRDVGLVGDAEHEDLRAGERALARVVQRLRDDRATEVRHRLVDLAGELDELGVEAVLPRLPGEVEGVDRDAVATEAGAGLERHEPERLRRGCVDDLPDVDVHPVAELRELVDERDVDGAEDVLEQLRQLGRLGRRHRVHLVDRRGVEGDGCGGRVVVDPADDLRHGLRRPVLAPGIDPLGREREVEVLSGGEPAPLLEDRLHLLGRRSRIGRRLEHDEMAASQACRDLLGGGEEDPRVRLALARERRRKRDEDRVRIARARRNPSSR